MPFLLRIIYPNLCAQDYLQMKTRKLFLEKKVKVCEDCYLYYQNIANNCEKTSKISNIFADTHGFFSSNTQFIAKRVENSLKNERKDMAKQQELLKFRDSNQEKPGNIENTSKETTPSLKKKRDFHLNLKGLHSSSSKIEEFFPTSERTTKCFTNRSKELTDRYASSRNMSDYFLEENSKFLKEMSSFEQKFQLNGVAKRKKNFSLAKI